jgi:hypothetical protein
MTYVTPGEYHLSCKLAVLSWVQIVRARYIGDSAGDIAACC